ncbi:MAG: regulatory protein RecX [Fusobacteriaceae bacterium]
MKNNLEDQNYILEKNKIVFENKVEFKIPRDFISKYKLEKSGSLNSENYKLLITNSCENYVIYLLALKDYFKKILLDKLLKIYKEKEIILNVLDKVEMKGYIDDYNMAKDYIRTHKNYGTNKLKFELMKKGISNSEISELLEENKETEYEILEKLIEKQKEKPQEKIIMSLMRKGFEYKIIKMILDGRK